MIRKLISFFNPKPSLEQEIEEALRKQLRLAGYARPYLRRGA